MSDTMKIRGEQIQDKTITNNLLADDIITTNTVKEISTDKIFYNNQPLTDLISKQVNFTININDWSNMRYTLRSDTIKSNSNGVLILNSNISQQVKEVMKCNLQIVNQQNGSIVISCTQLPEMNLDLSLILN